MSRDPQWGKLSRGWHSRGYLPHFDMPGLLQMITFCLADAITPQRLARLREELPPQRSDLFLRAVENELDTSAGSCCLRRADIAAIIEETLLLFDGQRYRVLAWVIMPNHVHVVIETFPGWPLSGILHSWKSFTAKAANKLLGKTGVFWQRESFDRVIRNDRHFYQAVDYIHGNPVKARLCQRTDDWNWSSYRCIHRS